MAELDILEAEDLHYPTYAHETDFGLDLYTSEDILVVPGMLRSAMAKTGLHVAFDPNKYGLFISPRSSLSKLPIILSNETGIIEGTYRGEVMIPLRNTLPFNAQEMQRFILKVGPKNKLEHLNIIEVRKQLRKQAQLAYIEDSELLTSDHFSKEVEASLFQDLVPMGTIYIPKGTRLVQAYLVPRTKIEPTYVTQLPDSERGTAGFGSTGNN